MVTPPDIEARILRLYHAEKWLIGTIARQLHVHYSVVGRVLAQAGLPRPGPPPRKSRIDPYLAFIRQTLVSVSRWPPTGLAAWRIRCSSLVRAG